MIYIVVRIKKELLFNLNILFSYVLFCSTKVINMQKKGTILKLAMFMF